MTAKKKKATKPGRGRPLTVHNKITELRGSMTRQELSDKSGVAYRNLTRYETGKMKPYGVNRAKLAAALGVKPEEL